MLSICQACDKLLVEGDYVELLVRSDYHVLKSTVAFALDQTHMIFDPETLKHVDCNRPKGDFEREELSND